MALAVGSLETRQPGVHLGPTEAQLPAHPEPTRATALAAQVDSVCTLTDR